MGFLDGIGWRDMVLVAAAMIGVYLVLSVMRLFQVAGKRRGNTTQAAERGFSGWQPDVMAEMAQQAAAPIAPVAPPVEFAAELARSNVEVECQALRRECAQLREELARLVEEVSTLKATRNMSPLYNEAMALARQGMSANGIAGRCDISIGEAELVAAMARSASEFEHHEQGEDRDEPNTDSGTRLHG
jgi:hypothetical protein